MKPGNITLQTQRLVRNVTWLSLQEVLIRVTGLATAIYLARVLSPSSYGQLGLAMAIVSIMTTLVQAGTGSRATRLTAIDPGSVPDTYAQITGLRLVVATVAILILILCAAPLSRVFSFPAILLILCSFLLLRPALTVIWAFRGLDRMHINAITDVVEKTLVLLGLVLLVHGRGNDLFWIPVLEVAFALATVIWLRKRLGMMYPGLAISFNTSTWPEITKESLPLGLAALLGSVYLHGAILFLGWLDTPASAADFLVAQKIMLTMAILIYVINKSAFPSTSRLLSTGTDQAMELLARLLRYYLVLFVPVILLLALYANEILALLFGASYSNAGPVLVVLLMALPFMAISNNLLQLLRSIPRPGDMLIARIFSTLVLLISALFLIPIYGALGAAAAVVISEASGLTILVWLVKRSLGSLPWNLRCFAPLAAGTLAACAFALLQSWSVPAGLAVAAVLYALLAWLLKAITTDELKSIPTVLLSSLRRNKAG